MFELDLKVFRMQMYYCIEEIACDNVETFRRPRKDLAPPW